MNQENKSVEELAKDISDKIHTAALAEEIYEPKYGGKDHSGYDTMMKYEINEERYDCFKRGAEFGYALAASPKGKEEEAVEFMQHILNLIDEGVLSTNNGLFLYNNGYYSPNDLYNLFKQSKAPTD